MQRCVEGERLAMSAVLRWLLGDGVDKLRAAVAETVVTEVARLVGVYFSLSARAVRKRPDTPELLLLRSALGPLEGANYAHLCARLAHPFPAVGVCARRLLGVALIDHVLQLDLSAAVPEPPQDAAEMAAVLADGDGEDEEEDKVVAKQREERRLQRKRRAAQRQSDQVDALLPGPLRALLEATAFCALRRGTLLSERRLLSLLQAWGLVLDLLQVLNRKTGTDKRAILLAFLRDADVTQGACSELFEHMVVSFTDSALCEHAETLKASARGRGIQGTLEAIIDDERLCDPSGPTAERASVPNYCSRLRRTRAESSEECVFFGGLAFRLYMATLSTAPALARAWYTNADRAAAHHIGVLTAKFISPFLVARELRDVNRGPKRARATVSVAPTQSTVQRPAPGVQIRDGKDDEEEGEDKDALVEDDDEEEEVVAKVDVKAADGEESDETEEEEEVEEEDEEVEFKILGIPAKSEVMARYVRGEIALSMAIRLDATHPLVPATVELVDAVKVKEARARRWQVTPL
jgi:hypothetical protein